MTQKHSPKTKQRTRPKSTQKVDAPALDTLKQINLNAAGLDVGANEIYACVPQGRDESSVRVFPTFTADLNSLANPLVQMWSYHSRDGIYRSLLDSYLSNLRDSWV